MLQILEFIYTGQTLLEKGRLDIFITLCTKLQIKGLHNTTELTTKVEKPFKSLSDNSRLATEVDASLPDLITSKRVLEYQYETKKETRLINLPPELVIKILSYVSTEDLLNNVAITSKQFYSLTKDQACHLNISLPFNVNKSAAAQFLTLASQIQELNIFTFEEDLFELRKAMPNTRAVLFCDEILAAVSMHTNLRVVNIEGMKARGSSLNSLASTNFYGKLSKLVLDVEENPSGFEVTALALCSTGKLRHVELNGMKEVDPRVIKNMAVSFHKLETLNTDCRLTNPDAIDILVSQKSTLKALGINKVEITDDLIEAHSECKNLESFIPMYYPPFIQLKNLKNLFWLHLDYKDNFSSELLERALSPGALPSLSYLQIRTEKEEDKLFSAIPKACPKLTSINIESHNQESDIQVFRRFISDIKIHYFSIWFKYESDYNISDIFSEIDGKMLELKFIGCRTVVNSPRREARTLLKQIPALKGTAFQNCLYVRSNEPIKRANILEKCTLGSYDQIHILEFD